MPRKNKEKKLQKQLMDIILLTKQLPDDYLSVWKAEVQKMISHENWNSAERLMNAIWEHAHDRGE